MKPNQLPEVFAKNLRAARVKAGISQRSLAERIGASPNSVVLWESGRSSPTLSSVVKLSEALDVPPEMLLTELGHEMLAAVPA